MRRLAPAVASLGGSMMLALACSSESGVDIPPPEAGAVDGAEPDSGDFELEPTIPDEEELDGGAGADVKTEAAPPGNFLWSDTFQNPANLWTRDEKSPATNVVEVVGGNLHVHTGESNQSRKAARWKTVATSFPDNSKILLSFRFKIVSATIDYFDIGAIQVNNTQFTHTEYGLASYWGCPGLCFDENAPPDEGPKHTFGGEIAYTPGVWYRAEVTVARSGNNFTGTTKVGKDGEPLVAVDTNGPTYYGPTPPTKVEVGLGIFFTSTDSGEADALFDEMTVQKL